MSSANSSPFQKHHIMAGCDLVITPHGSVQFGSPFDAFKRVNAFCENTGSPFPYVLVGPDDTVKDDMALWAPEFYILHHLFMYGAAFKPELRGERVRFYMNKELIPLARQSLKETLIGPDAATMLSWRNRQGAKALHQRVVDMLTRISEEMAVKNPDGKIRPVDEIVEFIPLDEGSLYKVFDRYPLRHLGCNLYGLQADANRMEVDITVDKRPLPLFTMESSEEPARRDVLGWIPIGGRSGFSTSGPNTGFLFWANGHPILFDGPYGTLHYCKQNGDQPRRDPGMDFFPCP